MPRGFRLAEDRAKGDTACSRSGTRVGVRAAYVRDAGACGGACASAPTHSVTVHLQTLIGKCSHACYGTMVTMLQTLGAAAGALVRARLSLSAHGERLLLGERVQMGCLVFVADATTCLRPGDVGFVTPIQHDGHFKTVLGSCLHGVLTIVAGTLARRGLGLELREISSWENGEDPLGEPIWLLFQTVIGCLVRC